jgi:hypothetical protein
MTKKRRQDPNFIKVALEFLNNQTTDLGCRKTLSVHYAQTWIPLFDNDLLLFFTIATPLRSRLSLKRTRAFLWANDCGLSTTCVPFQNSAGLSG